MHSGRPWQAEAVLEFVAFFCLMQLSLAWIAWWLASEGSENVTGKLVLMAAYQAGMAAVVWLFLRKQGLGWRSAFGLKLETAPAWYGWVLLIVILSLAGGWGSNLLSTRFIERTTGTEAEVQPVVQYLQRPLTPVQLASLLLIAVIAAPAVEEFLYRGVLYPAIAQYGGRPAGIIGSAALFGIAHNSWPNLLGLIFLAVLLTLLYERKKNLLAPILAHSLFNLINVICILLWRS